MSKKKETTNSESTMKFIAQIKPLQDVLAKVIAVIPSKSTLPQLETVLAELKSNTLTFTGTDLEITVIASFDVSGVSDGAANIPAKLFYEIIRALPEGEITFTLDKTTRRAQLQTAMGNYQIAIDENVQFPNTLANFEKTGSVNADIATINRIISKTLFAVSNDSLRPSMMGVLFQFSPDGTRAVATDGHRLVRITNALLKTESEIDIIVPSKTLTLVAKSFDDAENIQISFGAHHVEFQSAPSDHGSTTIISRLIDERYPNYEAVIPRENDKQLLISKDSMLRSVKRVSIFAQQNTRQLKFQISKNQMLVVAENFDAGNEGRESIVCDYANDEIAIGFNGRFIEDALGHLDTEEISLKFSTPNRACIIEPATTTEGEDLLMLVMPVRLNG